MRASESAGEESGRRGRSSIKTLRARFAHTRRHKSGALRGGDDEEESFESDGTPWWRGRRWRRCSWHNHRHGRGLDEEEGEFSFSSRSAPAKAGERWRRNGNRTSFLGARAGGAGVGRRKVDPPVHPPDGRWSISQGDGKRIRARLARKLTPSVSDQKRKENPSSNPPPFQPPLAKKEGYVPCCSLPSSRLSPFLYTTTPAPCNDYIVPETLIIT